VEARDLWFAYRGGAPVLQAVDFSVRVGGITMILGASGSGKTTLLKLIKGLLAPDRGRLVVLGEPVSPAGRSRRLRTDVAYIPQTLGLVRNLTVLENALIGTLGRVPGLPGLTGRFPPDHVAEAVERLTRLGLGDKIHERAYTLSGGERQRVAIARARLQHAPLILADEFVSQLDPATAAFILDVVKERTRSEGITYVQTTHELDLVGRYADHVVVLRHGRKVIDGPAASVDAGAIGEALRR
jgi:phosphonate transport system ATP-binding protein